LINKRNIFSKSISDFFQFSPEFRKAFGGFI
jgi:hypothetical protein